MPKQTRLEEFDSFLTQLSDGYPFLDYFLDMWYKIPSNIMIILARIAYEREAEDSTPKNLTSLLHEIPTLIKYCGVDTLDILRKHIDMAPIDTLMSFLCDPCDNTTVVGEGDSEETIQACYLEKYGCANQADCFCNICKD